MYCSGCGNKVAESVRFCPRCGASQTPYEKAIIAGQQKLIGTSIGNRYRIDEKIGAGGMGTVYRARRLLIGDDVAIKVLHLEIMSDPHAVERFRREAQAAARLKHPNAVMIYDFGVSEDGLFYLVMELVEGQSLRQIIRERGPLSPQMATEIVSQVCVVLEESHRNNIIHRDLKPDNIIVSTTTEGFRVKVLDFGIAKLRDISTTSANITKSGAMMGTPHYMSPEQCMGEELDGRSDIYSLGIVLYEMLTGVVPFNSPVSSAVIVQHVTQEPPPLRSINVSVSPKVEAVVMSALEKQREARPQTATDLTEQLTAAVSSGFITQPNAMRSEMNALPKRSTPITPQMSLPITRLSTPANEAATTLADDPIHVEAPPQVRSSNKRAFLVLGIAAVLIAIGAAIFLMLRARTGENQKQDNENQTQSAAEQKETPKPNDQVVPATPPPGMGYVSGGEFFMGSDAGSEAERPQHRVEVKPFFIDLYEVTCRDYQEFIQATSHPAPSTWPGGQYPSGSGRKPVTGISWDDAAAYAAWAGKRLPTEEEWEFAARGTTGFRYVWGNEWRPRLANADSSAHGHGGTAHVGEHTGASPFGAFDMIGNAWEWTSSDFAAYPGRLAQVESGLKVIRGGSWANNRNEATTTFRRGYAPRGAADYSQIGFRCVKDAPSPTGDASNSPSGTKVLGVSSEAPQEKKVAPKAARKATPSKSKNVRSDRNKRDSKDKRTKKDDSEDDERDDRDRWSSRSRRRWDYPYRFRFRDRYRGRY
ncbi:MAG TPA: SUMF1/EgtB/PvdO family nonheme iron enzyme [Blastocatellia bacterium]